MGKIYPSVLKTLKTYEGKIVPSLVIRLSLVEPWNLSFQKTTMCKLWQVQKWIHEDFPEVPGAINWVGLTLDITFHSYQPPIKVKRRWTVYVRENA